MNSKYLKYSILAGGASALDNGLGLTPQMGWNTWNTFGCNINEAIIMQTADKIVELGLDKVGYKYLNLDDCWMEKTRTTDGHLIVDSKAFPSGMKKTWRLRSFQGSFVRYLQLSWNYDLLRESWRLGP